MPKYLVTLIALMALVGCQAAQGTQSPTGSVATVSVPAAPTPTVAGQTLEPTPTPVPTLTPTAVPEAIATVVITRTFMKAWGDGFGGVDYEIVVEVQNTGTAPASISGSDDYTIYDKSGAVLETGNFTYALPQVVAPNELGYFIDGGSFDEGTKLTSVGKAEPSINYSQVEEVPARFGISKVRVTREPYGSGLQVSGVVKNTGTETATDTTLGIVFFDGTGHIIGGLIDNTVGTIAAGQSKGFKTDYPGTPPLSPTQVKSFKAFAYDYSFF